MHTTFKSYKSHSILEPAAPRVCVCTRARSSHFLRKNCKAFHRHQRWVCLISVQNNSFGLYKLLSEWALVYASGMHKTLNSNCNWFEKKKYFGKTRSIYLILSDGLRGCVASQRIKLQMLPFCSLTCICLFIYLFIYVGRLFQQNAINNQLRSLRFPLTKNINKKKKEISPENQIDLIFMFVGEWWVSKKIDDFNRTPFKRNDEINFSRFFFLLLFDVEFLISLSFNASVQLP